MKVKRPVVFTPGYRSLASNHDYMFQFKKRPLDYGDTELNLDYFKMENMFIYGVSGSGTEALTNSIVKSLIDSNNNYSCNDSFQFVFFDSLLKAEAPLGSTTRITSFNPLMKEIDADDYEQSICTFIKRLRRIGQVPKESVECYGKSVLVVVINNYSHFSPETQLVFKMAFAQFDNSDEVKFIVSSDRLDNELNMRFFPYRLVTRAHEADSNYLLGCNLASSCADKFGSLWFYDVRVPDNYTKYKVIYTPDKHIRRLMKVYADKDNCHTSVTAKFKYIKDLDTKED